MGEINPYAPPRTSHAAPVVLRAEAHDVAGLGKRFAGRLIDNVLAFAVASAVAHYNLVSYAAVSDALSPVRGFIGSEGVLRAVFLAGALPVFLLNWGLVSGSGQSLGKLVLQTRILRTDGSRAGVLRGVVLRDWTMLALSFVPVVGYGVVLFDALLILGRDRLTVHDRLAGTKVVDLARPLELDELEDAVATNRQSKPRRARRSRPRRAQRDG